MTLEISCGKRMPTLPHLGFVRPPGHHGTKFVNLDLSMLGLDAKSFFVYQTHQLGICLHDFACANYVCIVSCWGPQIRSNLHISPHKYMKATSVDLKIRTTNGYISVEAAIAVAAAVAVAAVEQSLQSAVTKTTSNNTLDLQIPMKDGIYPLAI